MLRTPGGPNLMAAACRGMASAWRRLVPIVVLATLAGCHNSRDLKEISSLKKRVASLSVDLAHSRAESRKLSAQVSTLSETANGNWSALLACTNTACREEQARRFLKHHPHDARALDARTVLADIKKKQEQAALLAKVAHVRPEVIRTAPAKYRGMLFQRTMCCSDVTASGLGWRGRYHTLCYWRYHGHNHRSLGVDLGSQTTVLLSAKQAPEVTAVPGADGNCKYLVTASMKFTGVVSYRDPVFTVVRLESVQTGPGTIWAR